MFKVSIWMRQIILRNFQLLSISTFETSWLILSFYGRRKSLSRKVQWTVRRGIPNGTDKARVLRGRLFWKYYITFPVFSGPADGFSLPPQWPMSTESIKFCYNLELSEWYGKYLYTTRRAHLRNDVTKPVPWYPDRSLTFHLAMNSFC